MLFPLIALALTLSSCGGADQRPVTDLAGPPPRVEKDTEQRSTSPRPSAKPNPTATSTTKPRSRSRSNRGKTAPLLPLQRRTVGTHLLAAERMPALGMDATWQVLSDGPEGSQSVGECQKTSLESLGAVTAVRRTYSASVERTHVADATQVVARFGDDKSAWRAHQVLRSWRQDCEDRLEYARKDVGPLRAVSVRKGTGENYRMAYGPKSRKRHRIAAFGIMRDGRHVSIVEVTFEPGHRSQRRDPSRVAVRRIARTFG